MCADESTFFLKDKISIKEFNQLILIFYGFKTKSIWMWSGMDRCFEKCTSVCGKKCNDLTKEAIFILGVFFSYDKNLKQL